jgi:hypothetical protein
VINNNTLTNQPLPSNTTTAITFTGPFFENGWTHVGTVFTAPIAALYQVTYSFNTERVNVSGVTANIFLASFMRTPAGGTTIDGSTATSSYFFGDGETIRAGMNHTFPITAIAGQTFDFAITHTSSGAGLFSFIAPHSTVAITRIV